MSLLDELRNHSVLDIDCNDAAVAIDYKPFNDMTSNQLIVLGQVRQTSHKDLIPEACKLAQRRRSEYKGVAEQDLAVDYLTALLGKAVAQHLEPRGYVHAQTLPSLAYDTEKTIQHALRLVKVYGELGVPQDRICIKIPSTVQGLQACELLESKHQVRTLATTCFTLSQGLAAAKAGCTYVAPYVNPLIVHIDPKQHRAYIDPLAELTGAQVTFAIQKAFRKIGTKTQVLAASLVTAEEVFCLCGIDHITLSANALKLIRDTPLDEHFKQIRERSLAHLEDPVEKDIANPFFVKDLDAAMADPAVDALQRDALMHFGAAETALRGICKEALAVRT